MERKVPFLFFPSKMAEVSDDGNLSAHHFENLGNGLIAIVEATVSIHGVDEDNVQITLSFCVSHFGQKVVETSTEGALTFTLDSGTKKPTSFRFSVDNRLFIFSLSGKRKKNHHGWLPQYLHLDVETMEEKK